MKATVIHRSRVATAAGARSRRPVRSALLLAAVVCSPAVAAEAPAAGAPFAVSPATLSIAAIKDVSPLSATFYITPTEPIDRLEILTMDLGEPPDRLLAGQIQLDRSLHEGLKANIAQRVIVSVADLGRPGEWRGELELRWRIAKRAGAAERLGTERVGLTVENRIDPVLALSSETAKVFVRGRRGGWLAEPTVARREVIVGVAKGSSGAEGIDFVLEELKTADQSLVLPAGVLRVVRAAEGAPAGAGEVVAPTRIEAGGWAALPLRIDLGGVERSGSYAGQVIVTSSSSRDLRVPVQIDVKAPPLGPFLLLVLGVGTALAITRYRASGMPKDEVRVRLLRIEKHLKEDEEFRRFCGSQRVEPLVVLAVRHLRDDNVEAAKTATSEAEAVWDNWSRFRPELLESTRAIESLRDEIELHEGFRELPCIVALRRLLAKTLAEEIPEYVDKPNDLVGKLVDPATGWQPSARLALALHQRLASLEGRVVTSEQREELDSIVGELEAVTDAATVTALSPLNERALKLASELPEPLGQAAPARAAGFEAPTREVAGAAVRRAGLRARFNLKTLRSLTLAIGMVLLVMVGWTQFYAGNHTFGAGGAADYLALFAWGFGAEASREQVTALVRGWGW